MGLPDTGFQWAVQPSSRIVLGTATQYIDVASSATVTFGGDWQFNGLRLTLSSTLSLGTNTQTIGVGPSASVTWSGPVRFGNGLDVSDTATVNSLVVSSTINFSSSSTSFQRAVGTFFFVQSSGTITSSTTAYIGPNDHAFGSATAWFLAPNSGTVRNMRTFSTANASGTYSYDVLLDSVATGISATVSGATNQGSDSTNKANVVPGQTIMFRLVTAAGTAPGKHLISLEYDIKM